jgi:hypothetical protein
MTAPRSISALLVRSRVRGLWAPGLLLTAALAACGSSTPSPAAPSGAPAAGTAPDGEAASPCDEACTVATACAERIGEPAHGSDCVAACEELPPDEQAAETARWAAVDADDDEACRAALGQ